MGLLQSKPNKKVNDSSSPAKYQASTDTTLTGMHPSPVGGHGVTSGGRKRKRKHKGTRKKHGKKRSHKRH